jgi:hypothetical protein
MWYISFLEFKDFEFQPRRSSRYSHYSLVKATVTEAASLGLYVHRITQAPPLICLFIEMASCVEEKLASKSESSFQDTRAQVGPQRVRGNGDDPPNRYPRFFSGITK